MSGWTEEKRQAERNRIYLTKPWLKSTGAKTPEGKAKSKMNACKSRMTERAVMLNKEFRILLKEQKEAMQRLNSAL